MTALSRRDENRNRHHQQLIDATLDAVAETGVEGASVSEIIGRAKLSRGMIHLHFGGKDELLLAAARYMSEDYFHRMGKALAGLADDPARILDAMITADLSPELLNPRSINIWYAFRGAARDGNQFARFSDTRDDRLQDMLVNAFSDLSAGDDPDLVTDSALGLSAMMEGLWFDYFMHRDQFDRIAAKRTVMRWLNGLYPERFNLAGPTA